MSLFKSNNEKNQKNSEVKTSMQMSKDEIREKYLEFSKRFAEETFESVYEDCENLKAQYSECYPLIMQLAVLYCNHFMLAGNQNKQLSVLKEAEEMFEKVMNYAKEKDLVRQAESMTASCCLMMGNTKKVFEILGTTVKPITMNEEIISQAHQAERNMRKALETSQAGIYQHILGILSMTPNFLMLTGGNPEKTEEIMRRTLMMADLYHMDRLHPNAMLQVYFTAAEVYCLQRNFRKAIDMLENYADISVNYLFPYRLHGDAYFNAIDEWFESFDLGIIAPRDEKFIKESVIRGVKENPLFNAMSGMEDYKAVLKKLELLK